MALGVAGAAEGIGLDIGAPAIVGRCDRLACSERCQQHDAKAILAVRVEADDHAVACGELRRGWRWRLGWMHRRCGVDVQLRRRGRQECQAAAARAVLLDVLHVSGRVACICSLTRVALPSNTRVALSVGPARRAFLRARQARHTS
eukprot:5553335-Prymnesium_polylepis.1